MDASLSCCTLLLEYPRTFFRQADKAIIEAQQAIFDEAEPTVKSELEVKELVC